MQVGSRNPAIVMAGLVPAIHVLLGMLAKQKTELSGMTRT